MCVTNVLRFDICLKKILIGEKYLFSSGGINSYDVPKLPFTCEYQSASCSLAPDDFQSNNVKLEDIYTGVGLLKSLHDNTCIIQRFNGAGRDIVCSPYYNFPYKKRPVIRLCGYSLSLFIHCLSTSQAYVDIVSNFISSDKHSYYINKSECMRVMILKIDVIDPEKHVIDLSW